MGVGYHRWLPEGVRWSWAAEEYEEWQLGMSGYDPDVYMEMALIKPGDNPNDAHSRRSYVAQFLTKQANKLINVPVLKAHQSAGVTLTLKNLSHGHVEQRESQPHQPRAECVQSVHPGRRGSSSYSPESRAEHHRGREGRYNGGPARRRSSCGSTRRCTSARIRLRSTRPAGGSSTQSESEGLPPVAETGPGDKFNNYWGQPQHIEIGGQLGLGEFSDDKIQLKKFTV